MCGSDLVFIPFDSSGRRCVGQVCLLTFMTHFLLYVLVLCDMTEPWKWCALTFLVWQVSVLDCNLVD